MKKILSLGALILLLSANAWAVEVSPDLSGTYNCNGYDDGEGNFQGTVTLTLDAKNSDPEYGYNAYRYKESTTDGEKYSGSVIANGNILSEHFENNEPDEYDDRGVSNIVVTYDQGAQGMNQATLHEFYYEPNYGKGDTGSEVCIKQS